MLGHVWVSAGPWAHVGAFLGSRVHVGPSWGHGNLADLKALKVQKGTPQAKAYQYLTVLSLLVQPSNRKEWCGSNWCLKPGLRWSISQRRIVDDRWPVWWRFLQFTDVHRLKRNGELWPRNRSAIPSSKTLRSISARDSGWRLLGGGNFGVSDGKSMEIPQKSWELTWILLVVLKTGLGFGAGDKYRDRIGLVFSINVSETRY